MTIEIHGSCDAAFERVREEFERNFNERDELGASLAVVVAGEPKVDLWAGWADAERTRPWEHDTIVVVHSVTKGLVSMCVHMLVERGLLEWDAPVARYWPEFAQAGKERITLRQLISHQAGLPVIDAPLSDTAVLEWETMVNALEVQAPVWEPGTKHGYHASTWGWLVGEVIRRATGKSPGTVLREELCKPLGLDFHLGFGPELDNRVADLAEPPAPPPGTSAPVVTDTPLRQRAFSIGIQGPGRAPDQRARRQAEHPAGGGHGNARSLARAFAAMANGGEIDGTRLLGQGQVAQMWEEQTVGYDEVLGIPSRYGLGFWLKIGELSQHRGERSFGHPGVGGAFGLADPELKLGFGYAMNRTGAAPRRLALERQVYSCLGVASV